MSARAVLLDLDGTLIDPLPGVTAAVVAAADALGVPVPGPEVMRRFIGPPLQDGLATLLHLDQEQVLLAVAAFRDSYSATGLEDCVVYNGVPEMLAALSSRGCHLAVATSKPEVFARRVLRHTRLDSAVHAVHGASLDGSVRHKAQVVRAALAGSSASREQTVLLGDRSHDVVGARECGIACLGAGWGYGLDDELQLAGSVAVARRPADVVTLLADRGWWTADQSSE